MITLREHSISVMLYCPFGFIDPPLALDERKHCDFYLGAGRPLPMKLDLLCPKVISQGRFETRAEGLGRIVPSFVTLTLAFVIGRSINGSVVVWRSICEETSYSRKCS